VSATPIKPGDAPKAAGPKSVANNVQEIAPKAPPAGHLAWAMEAVGRWRAIAMVMIVVSALLSGALFYIVQSADTASLESVANIYERALAMRDAREMQQEQRR
jgi:hypothetical protein